MDFGKLIYYYRRQKGWSQAKLCQDICSVTHLSKIENGSKEVHTELLNELCAKLDVSIEIESARLEEISSHIENVIELFQMKNLALAKEHLMALKTYGSYIENTEYLFIYEIVQGWFYLLEDQLNKGEKLILKLEKFKKKFSRYELYLYQFIIALYHYKQNSLDKALEILESINESSQSEDIFNEKITEYYFYKALISARLNKNGLAIHYCSKSLSIFQKQHNLSRLLDTELLLAIELIKASDFKRSEAILQKVYKNSMLYKDKSIHKSALHNLGYLYYRKKEYVKANEYYDKALKLVKVGMAGYYTLIINIIQNYLYLGELANAKELSEKVLQNLELQQDSSEYVIINCLYLEARGHEIELINYITNFALPKMIESKNTTKIIEFKEKLVDHFIQNKDFTQATNHLIDCNKLLKAR